MTTLATAVRVIAEENPGVYLTLRRISQQLVERGFNRHHSATHEDSSINFRQIRKAIQELQEAGVPFVSTSNGFILANAPFQLEQAEDSILTRMLGLARRLETVRKLAPASVS